jgi:AcrR family transcriptional regulator
VENESAVPTSRRERKKAAMTQNILVTAVRLFETRGFAHTTMEQIAGEADIAKATLYHYFPDKEAVLGAYVQRSFAEREPTRLDQLQSLPDTRARLTRLLTVLMERVQVHSEMFERYLALRTREVVSLRPRPEPGAKSAIDRLALAIIARGREDGEVRRDLPLDMVVDLFEFVFVEIAKQFFQAPEQFNAQETIAQAVDLFLGGVGTTGHEQIANDRR